MPHLPVLNYPAIYVIHENSEWMVPLQTAFNKLNIPFAEWYMDGISFELGESPPDGVFFNRMSASAHTRSHSSAPNLTRSLLSWLELHGRRIVNGERALNLELSKSEQYLALQKYQIPTPKTFVATDGSSVMRAAQKLNETPFIVKPNRGGKGLGVTLFHSLKQLEDQIDTLCGNFYSVDGLTLVQSYIKPLNDKITRLEFIGGKLFYAVEVDTSGGFERCPADSCGPIIESHDMEGTETVQGEKEDATGEKELNIFRVKHTVGNSDLISNLEIFFRDNHIDVAAAEFTQDQKGRCFVYDLNMNTNYNRQAEMNAGDTKQAMIHLANYLGNQLEIK